LGDKTSTMRTVISFFTLCFIPLVVAAQGYMIPAESPFDQVRVAGNIHLQLVASDSLLLQFEEEGVPEELDIAWGEQTLTLKIRSEIKKSTALNVKLYYKTLSQLEVSRGAVVRSADTLKTKTLTLKVEAGGKAELLLVTDSLSARVNQGADIILRGTTRTQLIHANTVGNFLGYELGAERTWIKATTGAQVKINSSRFLNVTSTGKAFVGYMGTPEIKEFKHNMGGEITQQNP
jgi:hypothetical protein